jgi:hypothetical protein
VASEGLKRRWYLVSQAFQEDFLVSAAEAIHPYTCAHELIKTGVRTLRASNVAAGAWLERYDPDGKETVTEDSIALGSLGLILSLIWVGEDI